MKTGQKAVLCIACGDPYGGHERGGGACRVVDEDGRCPCKGFRWVPVDGPAVRSYANPPTVRR